MPLPPLTSEQMNGYETYNAFASREISAESLMADLVELLKHKEIVYQAAKNSDLFDEMIFENEYDSDLYYRRFANSVILSEPQPKNNQHFKSIVFNVNNVRKVDDFVAEVLNAANANVKRNIITRVNSKIEVELQKRDFAILDLQSQATRLKNDFQFQLEQRITFIEEQLKIAKATGISKPALNQLYINDVGINSGLFSERAPLFLRGHIALSEEIKLLKNRTDPLLFVPGLIDIYSKIEELKDVGSLNRELNLLLETPIGQDNFSAVGANLKEVAYFSKNISNYLVLFLSAILGGAVWDCICFVP